LQQQNVVASKSLRNRARHALIPRINWLAILGQSVMLIVLRTRLRDPLGMVLHQEIQQHN
jgi:hypothetical protein